MFRFKFNLEWKYVDVYFDEIKIVTINYVSDYEEALRLAREEYLKYVEKQKL